MLLEREFLRDLYEMFDRRIEGLKSIMNIPQSRRIRKKISRNYVESKVDNLCYYVSAKFSKSYFKSEFFSQTKKEKKYFIEGRGVKEKKLLFKNWINETFPKSPLLIYLFFGKDRCLYVGKTGRGGRRPLSHFDKHWIHQAKSIVIYEIRSISHLPKLECLASHYYQPQEFQKFPSLHKWTKACPICEKYAHIQKEIRKIFRLKYTTKKSFN